MNHIDEIEDNKRQIELAIERIVEPFSDSLALLRTVPGLDKNPMTAIAIISEFGADMSVFPSSKHLCLNFILSHRLVCCTQNL